MSKAAAIRSPAMSFLITCVDATDNAELTVGRDYVGWPDECNGTLGYWFKNDTDHMTWCRATRFKPAEEVPPAHGSKSGFLVICIIAAVIAAALLVGLGALLLGPSLFVLRDYN